MTALLSLLAMLFWGMVLCFGYQCFLYRTEGKTYGVVTSVLLYAVSGALCFILTALFLYVVDRGQWGIYGFLAMVGGFFLYHQKLWRWGERVVNALFGAFSSVGGGVSAAGGKVGDVAVFPFGKIVDKGEEIMETAEKQWEKRKKEKAEKAEKAVPQEEAVLQNTEATENSTASEKEKE